MKNPVTYRHIKILFNTTALLMTIIAIANGFREIDLAGIVTAIAFGCVLCSSIFKSLEIQKGTQDSANHAYELQRKQNELFERTHVSYLTLKKIDRAKMNLHLKKSKHYARCNMFAQTFCGISTEIIYNMARQESDPNKTIHDWNQWGVLVGLLAAGGAHSFFTHKLYQSKRYITQEEQRFETFEQQDFIQLLKIRDEFLNLCREYNDLYKERDTLNSEINTIKIAINEKENIVAALKKKYRFFTENDRISIGMKVPESINPEEYRAHNVALADYRLAYNSIQTITVELSKLKEDLKPKDETFREKQFRLETVQNEIEHMREAYQFQFDRLGSIEPPPPYLETFKRVDAATLRR